MKGWLPDRERTVIYHLYKSIKGAKGLPIGTSKDCFSERNWIVSYSHYFKEITFTFQCNIALNWYKKHCMQGTLTSMDLWTEGYSAWLCVCHTTASMIFFFSPFKFYLRGGCKGRGWIRDGEMNGTGMHHVKCININNKLSRPQTQRSIWLDPLSRHAPLYLQVNSSFWITATWCSDFYCLVFQNLLSGLTLYL